MSTPGGTGGGNDMQRFRSTSLLLVLFLALGGYAYFIESERSPASEDPPAEQAFDIEADAITSLTVTSDNGDVTEVSRSDTDTATWSVTAPFSASADGNAASAIANSLASLEISRVVETEATDLSVFGLTNPTFSVEFGSENNVETLLIGDETPTGSDRYANIGGTNRVFLIASFHESTFNRSSLDLRDRSLLEFTGTDVTAMTIEHSSSTLRFSKTDGAWNIIEPVRARGDFGIVEGLSGRIGSAEMITVEAESIDSDLEPFGLDEPQMTVTMETDTGNHVLVLGNESPEGTIYGRDTSRALVFTADAALFDELARDINTYRKKELFDFQPFNISGITFTRNDETYRFEKGTDNDDTPDAPNEQLWQQIEPDQEVVEAIAFDDFLSKLSGLRAESFLNTRNNTGVGIPLATFTVTYGNDQQETVTIGQTEDTYHGINGEEDGAAIIESTSVSDILEAIDLVLGNTVDSEP